MMLIRINSKINNNKILEELINIDSKENLSRYNEKLLLKLLLHSYNNVKYYKKILKNIKITNGKNVDLLKFHLVPILTKNDIRNNFSELKSMDINSRKWSYNFSGGSTGEPLKFIQDENYKHMKNITVNYHFRKILNFNNGNMKSLYLWNSERDIRKSFNPHTVILKKLLNRQIILNTSIWNDKQMENYVRVINHFKPDFIKGYASSLYSFSNYVNKNKKILHSPKILASGAEKLNQDMRKEIECAFKTKVYNFYGSRETGVIARECKYGLLHIMMFNNYIELLDNNNIPVKEDEKGRVVVTNLHNYSMPFIRYDIGDLAIRGPDNCRCGNVLPTIKHIEGRVIENVLKEDGTVIPGTILAPIFYENLKDWFKTFKLIQEDYKKFVIQIVLNKAVDESDKWNIEKKLKIFLGEDCSITWEYIDEIEKLRSGKHTIIHSNLWDWKN